MFRPFSYITSHTNPNRRRGKLPGLGLVLENNSAEYGHFHPIGVDFMATPTYLPFEKDIQELEAVLTNLESKTDEHGATEEIRQMRREVTNLKRKVYNNLTAWDTVLVSRHPERPQTVDYIDMIFDEFVELHGDRAIGDDRAIRTGFARIGDHRVLLVGQQKGHTLKERNECLFGCAHPEGYRKALGKKKLARL